jgi:hypothetical protein
VRFDARIVPTGASPGSRSARPGADRVRWLRFAIDPVRHFEFRGDGRSRSTGNRCSAGAAANGGVLRYSFWIDHLRNHSSYDALRELALFRETTWSRRCGCARWWGPLELSLRLGAEGWSAAAPHQLLPDGSFAIDDPDRRF